MSTTHERVVFRLIRTPCCGHLLCWVNPRLPIYCPECGTGMLLALKSDGSSILQTDDNAVLTLEVNNGT